MAEKQEEDKETKEDEEAAAAAAAAAAVTMFYVFKLYKLMFVPMLKCILNGVRYLFECANQIALITRF